MGLILAIDPGNEESAYCFLGSDYKIRAIDKISNNQMLNILKRNALKVDVIAIEGIASYGMAVGASVFETCSFIGRIIQCCFDIPGFNKTIHTIFRKTVITHITDVPKGNDTLVRMAMIDKYGPPSIGTGKHKTPGPTHGIAKDMWSALAIATYFCDVANSKIKLDEKVKIITK